MGVPSQHCFNKYLKEEFPDEEIEDINFRYKEKGWSQNLFLRIESDKGIQVIPCRESSYYWAFLKTITNCNSCASCLYAGTIRQGDITIGDFWGWQL